MELVCPYCNSSLIQGFIDSGRYSFKWHNNKSNIIEKYTVFGGEVLSHKSRIRSYRCEKMSDITGFIVFVYYPFSERCGFVN